MSTLPLPQILTIPPLGLLQNDIVEKLKSQPPLVIGSLGRGKAELS